VLETYVLTATKPKHVSACLC